MKYYQGSIHEQDIKTHKGSKKDVEILTKSDGYLTLKPCAKETKDPGADLTKYAILLNISITVSIILSDKKLLMQTSLWTQL